jgi:hypothetical protein
MQDFFGIDSCDIASRVSLRGLGNVREFYTDGNTRYNADGQLVPIIAIPAAKAARAEYDARFLRALSSAFETAGRRLTGPIRIPIDPRVVSNKNPVRNDARYAMYREMLRDGTPLPPVVVEVSKRYDGSTGYLVLDGNHRWFAAQAEGVPFIEGYVLEAK